MWLEYGITIVHSYELGEYPLSIFWQITVKIQNL